MGRAGRKLGRRLGGCQLQDSRAELATMAHSRLFSAASVGEVGFLGRILLAQRATDAGLCRFYDRPRTVIAWKCTQYAYELKY